MRQSKLYTLMILATLLSARCADATPITLVWEGTWSGKLNDVPFTNEPFVYTATADTSLISAFADGRFVSHDALSIEMLSQTLSVSTATSSYVNNTYGIVGNSNDYYGNDLMFVKDPALSSWDLESSIGPMTISGADLAIVSQFGTPLQTSGGELRVNDDFNTTITFSATVVPEPATLTGVAMFLGLIWRRRNRVVNRSNC